MVICCLIERKKLAFPFSPRQAHLRQFVMVVSMKQLSAKLVAENKIYRNLKKLML